MIQGSRLLLDTEQVLFVKLPRHLGKTSRVLDKVILPPGGQVGCTALHIRSQEASPSPAAPEALAADYFKNWAWPLWDKEAWEQVKAAGSRSQALSPLTGGGRTAWGLSLYQSCSDGTELSLTPSHVHGTC